MAHHKDALKRIRQNAKRKEANQTIRTYYRNRIKKVRAALETGEVEAAQTALATAISAIDRAVTKGILHKNTGSRYKSRLTKAVTLLKESKQAA